MQYTTEFKVWFQATRWKTLPLSLAGILVGSAVTTTVDFNITVFVLAICTAMSFQIISNLANDYGDGIKGTDNPDRIGPVRSLQSGLLSKNQLKKGIIIALLMAFVLLISLLYTAFGWGNFYSIFFMILGVLAMVAAVKYTVGKNAYGYKGRGDVFVFIFFGVVSVLGSNFLFIKQVNWDLWLLAITIGALSTAVLNLNNMRDIENDKKSGKNTFASKIGKQKAKIYHYALLCSALISAVFYALFFLEKKNSGWFILGFIPLIVHFVRVYSVSKPEEYTPELKKVTLNTFLIGLLFFLEIKIFS